MNRRISRLGIALLVCYLAVFVQLNRLQFFQAEALNDDPANRRVADRLFNQFRGPIVTADGVVIAESTELVDSRFDFLRTYPEGELYAQVTGHLSVEFGSVGLEATYDEELSGLTTRQQFRELSDLFVARDTTGRLVTTIDSEMQEAARVALGEQRGSVVALDPRTGSVLALWTWPTYDPNELSSHDIDAVRAARTALTADPDNPLLAKTYRERFFPGSTFKVVTAAAGIEAGSVTLADPVYDVTDGYLAPGTTRPLRNFGGSTCGGTLLEIMAVSCNTSFAEMGAVTIGPDVMVERAEAFGFNEAPPIDLPAPATSVFPDDYGDRISGPGGPDSVYENSAALAQASIGQNDVSATPLQMALVAGAVANDGIVMTPHLQGAILDSEGGTLETYSPRVWQRATSARTATILRQAMIGVVTDGTAELLQIDGVVVGAKTGTAQLGTIDSSHAWVIAFAGLEGQEAEVAVAVLVEAQPGASEQTGGRVAAPIAREVILAALGVTG